MQRLLGFLLHFREVTTESHGTWPYFPGAYPEKLESLSNSMRIEKILKR